MHEQAEGHKTKMAERLRQARFANQKAEQDKEQVLRSLGGIEAGDRRPTHHQRLGWRLQLSSR